MDDRDRACFRRQALLHYVILAHISASSYSYRSSLSLYPHLQCGEQASFMGLLGRLHFVIILSPRLSTVKLLQFAV